MILGDWIKKVIGKGKPTSPVFKPWKFGTREWINNEYQIIERPYDYEIEGYGGAPSIYDSDGNQLVGCDEYYIFSGPEIVELIVGIPDMMNEIQRLQNLNKQMLEALDHIERDGWWPSVARLRMLRDLIQKAR